MWNVFQKFISMRDVSDSDRNFAKTKATSLQNLTCDVFILLACAEVQYIVIIQHTD